MTVPQMKTLEAPPRRGGFTLVELLVVITIIGVLAGIAVPVAFSVRNAAIASALKFEATGMEQSVNSYQLKYGNYPPDFIDGDIVRRHYRTAFPNISATELTLVAGSTNANSVLANMDRAEVLVWNLGGFSDDPERPFTGKGGPLDPIIDYASMTQAQRIDLNNYQYTIDRVNPFFAFG
ncbi:MAG: prepilin-type N-terminal cleavage/methylation domain-containing protein, partial [Planctomycetota bacterium]